MHPENLQTGMLAQIVPDEHEVELDESLLESK